jgi:hypothetical protein
MMNDTAVFAAMLFDPQTGENVSPAPVRYGYSINPISLNFCPHEWIDSRGYVDLDFAGNAPLAQTLPHGADAL